MEAEKIRKVFTMNTKYGLHTRPSSLFVKAVSPFESSVTVIKDDIESDGKSIMDLMILAAGPGDQLEIITEGNDALITMNAIEALFASKFGEA